MIVCVTGPMASGKNATSKILEQCGFASIDADVLVHKAIEKTAPEIIKEFSPEAAARNINLIHADGTLDRHALGALIFPFPELLARQEAIVYPVIGKMIEAFIKENDGGSIAINAAVLYKIPDLMKRCSKIFYINAPVLLRYLRARQRDRIPCRQILARFKVQSELLKKYRETGIPIIKISNTGSIKKLEVKIRKSLKRNIKFF